MPELLKIVADNPALAKALRELLEAEFDLDNLSTNASNVEIGEKVRARLDGLICIEKAFKKINQHKSTADRPNGMNPAR